MSMYADPGMIHESVSVRPMAMGLTCQEAIAQARIQLCALGWGCSASDVQIVDKIRSDCTLFVGNDPIRLAIFGTAQCPTNAASCLSPSTRYNCVSGQCVAAANGTYATLAECQAACDGGGGGGDNTMLIVGLGAVAVLAAVILATAPTSKKIIVAKVAQ